MESVLSAELYVVPLVERIASMMAPSRNPRTVAIHSCRDGIRDGRPRFAVKLRAIHARQQRDRAVCRGRTVLGERVCPACIIGLRQTRGAFNIEEYEEFSAKRLEIVGAKRHQNIVCVGVRINGAECLVSIEPFRLPRYRQHTDAVLPQDPVLLQVPIFHVHALVDALVK